MSTKTFGKSLRVALTDEETLSRAKDLAKAQQDLEETERSKKEVMDDFKSKVSRHESEISILSRAISNGYEYRDVPCYWDYNWTDGRKSLVRTDTMETVETEKISDWERQERIGEDD